MSRQPPSLMSRWRRARCGLRGCKSAAEAGRGQGTPRYDGLAHIVTLSMTPSSARMLPTSAEMPTPVVEH
jgi:hypothetical protein